MSLTDSDILKFQKGGTPYIFEDVCAIYSATLGEIVDEGYDNFQQYLGLLTTTKPMVHDSDKSEMAQVLRELTDFQYILFMTAIDAQMNDLARRAFRFFTHEEVLFSIEPAQIVIGPAEEQHLLNEGNFLYDRGPFGAKTPIWVYRRFFTGFSKKNEIFAHFLGKIGNFFTV